MAKPKSLIYIEVIPGGPRLKYAQRGGGVFRSVKHAEYRMNQLRRSGVPFKVWTADTDWKEIESLGLSPHSIH